MKFNVGEMVRYLGRKRVITHIVHVKGKQRIYFGPDGIQNTWNSECKKI